MPSARAAPPRTPAQQRHETALRAARHLRRACPRMRAIITRVGAFRPSITRDPFRCLAGAILQQQISMAAAATIQRKLELQCPRGKLAPEAILALGPEALRSAGLSRQKTLYMTLLAQAFADGVLSARRLRRMPDEEVIAATTAIKGIGRWTAEMLLIFSLERPDVWPIDDLGLRHAVAGYLGREPGDLPGAEQMRAVGAPFAPWRSYASWYLWRSREGDGMPGVRVRPATGR